MRGRTRRERTSRSATAPGGDLFANVQDDPDVLGFVWFDYDKTGANEADWMIDSDPTSAATFKSLAQGPDWGFPITP